MDQDHNGKLITTIEVSGRITLAAAKALTRLSRAESEEIREVEVAIVHFERAALHVQEITGRPLGWDFGSTRNMPHLSLIGLIKLCGKISEVIAVLLYQELESSSETKAAIGKLLTTSSSLMGPLGLLGK